MKKISIAITTLLCLLVTLTFAQRKQDKVEVDNPKKTTVNNNLISVEKEPIFGYHPNNYKHPVKAEKADKWFNTTGSVHREVRVTNYKMPFQKSRTMEKAVVKEFDAPKRSRNYKRPYSSN